MTAKHLMAVVLVLAAASLASLQWHQPLALSHQWQLLGSPQLAESFDEFNFAYAQLPRLVMTLIVGAMLGLVGSLMQQLTQNSLTSPLTMGTSSGAWLALIIVSIWWPDAIADYSAMAAMTGALVAFGLILLIAGIDNMTGLPMVISGMVINILLGAIAGAIILLHQDYAQNVFMWGAGDLAQNGWEMIEWLVPRLSPLVLLLLLAPRVLTLLRLGHQGAQARGLSVIPAFFLLMTLGIWLVSASITVVGLIGFIGLLTPNIVRALGARTPRMELLASLVFGALLLLLTDMLAQGLTGWLGQVVPSGVTAAAIGAPALIWFSRRQLKAQDGIAVALPGSRRRVSRGLTAMVTGLLVAGVALYFCYQPDSAHAWLALPSDYQWSLRWPRALTALCTGIGLALAGTILQRLIYNPLASPDILGVSAGATFALVFSSLFLGQSLVSTQWGTALAGSMAVLAVLILLGRKHQFAPSSVILTGIAMTALLQAFVQFCLAKGNQDSYKILQWLAGSTYRVTAEQAMLLFGLVVVLFVLSLMSSRALTLISISRSFATARGLNSGWMSLGLLVLVAMLCAVVTATMGPVAFVGLIAPHLARMLGAQQVKAQLLLGSLIGATTMLWSDWLGQVLLFPNQIAAGTLVAILGALYFLILLLVSRMRRQS
ncbi:Fe(3+)-hydroxamate ABC transporter permease FhuB [Vibrio furnissii]|uniref:Fe(3+)-hydroxamate ABC transporter permease FhuB n=2 Tax=Vibrio furnissii TaxID=29494 RepID=UPI0001B92665|nr:Fe(3+)-hydroxamate ABC transporter permease FhuB [Vibrio furnissii]EEX39484.1 ferrichrome transport system permease protein FhuB [Vibrio furnissii CIP 102972]QDC91842.1 Fe(3+)-hydroxamate ABC transporter permease FhuB [Vibrio furnissii]UON49518.1 Fe(3+)-hydroxamate ABC transporter permease FhuB [Vibrio furnissii]SUP42872.1 iron-hydroxamate transporter permease subunit [Vibrio furnissii]